MRNSFLTGIWRNIPEKITKNNFSKKHLIEYDLTAFNFHLKFSLIP
jgi:hypothetical protein